MRSERNKPLLLNREEKAPVHISEVRYQKPFFVYETCGQDVKEFIEEKSLKQEVPLRNLVKSINESEDAYKRFWKAFEVWKAKRATPASPAL